MSFIISGDTHGTLDIDKIKEFFAEHEGEYSSNDYLIICGDVGVCGFIDENERETREVYASLPVTTLFIDGNHEHFDKLNAYPVEEWNGGKVQFIEDRLIHLMRGQVFDINGTRFFTFGGAESVDKMFRTEGVSWFPQEIPTEEEYEEGWRNLEKNDFSVDYIITHAGPDDVIMSLGFRPFSEESRIQREYLQRVADNTEFKAWYFGHFHIDIDFEGDFHCLFNDMVVLP